MNLKEILGQEGHSGVLEGNCRVHYKGDFLSTKEYFNDDETENDVDVTFSCGTQGLGTYLFRAVSFNDDRVSGQLQVIGPCEISVEIDTEIEGMADFCRFRAILYKK